MKRPTCMERLMRNVSIPNCDGCWLWVGRVNKQGYGSLSMNGSETRAHRAMYIMVCGAIPAGKFVCHKCDNPSCVRSSHLWVGTHVENMADMAAKGRGRGRGLSGEKNGVSKLKASDVVEIRRRYSAGGVSQSSLAAEFGVNQKTIGYATTGRGWASVSRDEGSQT